MSLRKRFRRFEPVVRHFRPLYRWMRTAYLRRRYPEGAYVIGNETRVYCDFNSPTYVWYDSDSPDTAFERRVLLDLLKRSEGNVFIDVGAHFGFFAKIMAEVARSPRQAKVIAIEPDRAAFHCLTRTLDGAPEVIALLNVAVSDVDGELPLYRSANAPCLHSYSEPGATPAYRVPAERLDSILAKSLGTEDKVAVIKIDIDGAEWLFLDGAAETLRRHRPILFIEFSPISLRGAGVDPSAFLERLHQYGALEWMRVTDQTVCSISPEDGGAMIADIGPRVADLVVSPRP
jgi:FkbM family methyltransferase